MPPRPLLLATLLAVMLGGCIRDDFDGSYVPCEHQDECGVALDCVLLRPSSNGSTGGEGFCTPRCHPLFPCARNSQLCVGVDYQGVISSEAPQDASNAFCLIPCEDDGDCPGELDCREPEVMPGTGLCM